MNTSGSLAVPASFHSISFPSEWGVVYDDTQELALQVSIQLVSPASGEMARSWVSQLYLICQIRFHSISFPSEWGEVYQVYFESSPR